MSRGAARDIVSFRALAEKLWRPFVQPIVDGTYGTRDFSKLMVLKRPLFQTERWLVQGIVEGAEEGVALKRMVAFNYPQKCWIRSALTDTDTHDLAYYSKYLLCAAYLASYNPARLDPIYFMKGSEKKRKRKGGGGPSGRVAKHRKVTSRPIYLPKCCHHLSPF
jgi:origin recognition complex subunit 5